jgi:hypothetical protein
MLIGLILLACEGVSSVVLVVVGPAEVVRELSGADTIEVGVWFVGWVEVMV